MVRIRVCTSTLWLSIRLYSHDKLKIISRDRAVRQLARVIIWRSWVQIPVSAISGTYSNFIQMVKIFSSKKNEWVQSPQKYCAYNMRFPGLLKLVQFQLDLIDLYRSCSYYILSLIMIGRLQQFYCSRKKRKFQITIC